MASSASLFAKGPGLPDKDEQTQGLVVKTYKASKKRFDVVISMGQLKWHTKVSYSQTEKFHDKVDKNFPSLSFLPMPDKKKWSEESSKELLEDILQYESVRESVDLLKIIGIKTKITDDVPEYMKTFVDNWRTPLEDLDKPIREAVGNLILFFRVGWDSFELARYVDNSDSSYKSTNSIKKLDKDHQRYFDQITAEVFERLNLPAPKEGAPATAPSLDDSVHLLREELDEEEKWSIVWEILLQATINKGLDSRVLVSVQMCARLLELSLEDLAVAEQECAAILQRQLIEMRKQKDDNRSKHRKLKIGAGAAVGGGVMAVTGVLVLPLLVPAMMLGVGTVAAVAAPVAGSALASGIGAAGALLASASSFLPLFFGAFGAGLCGYKVGHVTDGIEEFHFVRVVAKEKEKSRSIIEIASLEDEDDDGSPGERYVLDIAGKRIIDLDQKQILPGKEAEIDGEMIVGLIHAAAGSIGFNPKKDGLKAAEERAAEQDKHRLRRAKDRLHEKRYRHKEAKKIKQEEDELRKQEKKAEKAKEATKEEPSNSENDSDSDTSRALPPSIQLQDKQELSELNEEESEMVENAGMEVVICVNGWLWNADDIDEKFSYVRQLHPGAEVYSLAWQSEELLDLGHFLTNFVKDEITSRILENAIVALSSSVGALLAALALPQYLMAAAALIDNPWTVVSNQARRAGKLLARAIISRAAGNRPITLIGWSHGARMIFSALEELNKLDNEDHRGLIHNVILMGAPVTTKPERWEAVRPLVAGRMVNCYSYADWLLPVIHRAGSGKIKPSAGNRAIEVPTVENFDITMIVGGHLNYSRRLKRILKFLDMQNSMAVSYAYRSCDDKLLQHVPDKCLQNLHKERKEHEKELRADLLKRREELLTTLIA